MVSGVGPGIDVRNGSSGGSREGVDFGLLVPIGPVVSMAQFSREMYSTHAWKVENISVPVSTIYHWNLRFVGFLKMY